MRKKLRRIVGTVVKRLREHRAARHRNHLGKVADIRWIGVTGSCGKSTTVHLLTEVLRKRGRCPKPSGGNLPEALPVCLLRVTSSHNAVVQEIGTMNPGHIRHNCRIFRPEIGVVMNVGTDHYAQFRSEDAIAHEKADLVRALPSDGVAILNADDPRVAAMAGETKARIVTFGIEKDADYRAHAVAANWPSAVGFRLEHEGKSYHLQSRLFGCHLVPNLLACIAAAHTCGMPIEEAIAALSEIEPVDGRMSEVKAPDGVTFIRDDYKAPWWGLPLTIGFLCAADAQRKVLVLGEMSDNPGNKARKFRRLINSALDQLDMIVVVGEAAGQLNESLLASKKIQAFHTIKEAHDFLTTILQPGDLVVLKGLAADHLERLARARVETVGCWRDRCGRRNLCTGCEFLAVPAGSNERLPQRNGR
ncbi:MAG: UDP-N-acetylmuramoyl-tripeptide--D-alanyl-D-alanine ligase [Verrucomicrobia bacterium]|nr:UDP-N-acetylmuramoyl-tripeptide--D-alanyl-D-alanine ligase [Verrucomicrobiota bacterium]